MWVSDESESGDYVADLLLVAVRRAGPAGLTETGWRHLFTICELPGINDTDPELVKNAVAYRNEQRLLSRCPACAGAVELVEQDESGTVLAWTLHEIGCPWTGERCGLCHGLPLIGRFRSCGRLVCPGCGR
jgi:hypothetical protein